MRVNRRDISPRCVGSDPTGASRRRISAIHLGHIFAGAESEEAVLASMGLKAIGLGGRAEQERAVLDSSDVDGKGAARAAALRSVWAAEERAAPADR